MQIFRLFFSIFLFFTLSSCEKELASDEQTANASDELTDDIKRSALTVAEAMDIEPGYWITVKGFIVAAAESSIKNADFRSPFAGKTAILLADEPADGTDEQIFSDLMPISLSDAAKGISASFNLQENANRWNNFVYIHGIRKQYMSAPGIKEIKNIWIGDPDEQPDPVVNPEDPDDPDDPNNPDINDGDNDGVLSVAQGIKANLYDIIKVKGYIVGTTSKSMDNAKFENIHEDYTAILLADEPGATDKKQLLPVETPPSLRKQLAEYGANLKNMVVIAIGTKDTYLGQPGIKQAKSITRVP